MDRGTFRKYAFLTVCIVVLSVLLPTAIRFVAREFVNRITPAVETENVEETEAETEVKPVEGTTTIGDPSLYQEDPNEASHSVQNQNDVQQVEKYEALVEEYQSYLSTFTKDTVTASTMKQGEMEQFIAHDSNRFFEAAATFAYSEWGTDRTIRQIRFDSITSYTDSNGDEVEQVMLEFLHTSHPETEEGIQVICIYYVNQDYYYFP